MERLTTIAELGPEPAEAKVAASYMANPPLVGRAALTTEFESALAETAHERGRSLLVEAEPGAGQVRVGESANLDGPSCAVLGGMLWRRPR